MKISFKKNSKEMPREALFVSVGPKNKDEIVKENGVKTLYLKSDEKMNLRKLFLLVRKMIALAKSARVERLAFDFENFKLKNAKLSDAELGELIGTQLDFANYEFTEYKTPPPEGFPLIKEVFVMGASPEAQKAILKGREIAEEVNKTRSLANTPGGDMTPRLIAERP